MDQQKGHSSKGNRQKPFTTESHEEQDESTSNQGQLEVALASFRKRWQKELQSSPKHTSTKKVTPKNDNDDNHNDDYEHVAKVLFLKGVELEKAGKLYEAIQFYRKAVQIVPDIEFKIDNFQKPKHRQRTDTETSDDNLYVDNNFSENDNSEDDPIEDGQLFQRIQKKMSKGGLLCFPKFEQNTTHISELPVEILLYILRWLVSSDLDLRSLEFFGRVCRGFYLCARDSEIWRLACIRAWGVNCGLTPGIYDSWRNMFIQRARLQFNGCYISKTTYIRHGENSFQDQFYRPWHLVAYYRYFRFFPEGLVLMLTSPDEPTQCVSSLKNRNPRPPVMVGYYRLKDDKVTIAVQRQENKVNNAFKRNAKRRDFHENSEQTFHIELKINNHHKKRHVQLIWTYYSVFTRTKRGEESTCNFDLIASRFPPLWFSRVKSYTAESECPLT